MSYKHYQKAIDDTVSYAVKWTLGVLLQQEGVLVEPVACPPHLTVAFSGRTVEVKQ